MSCRSRPRILCGIQRFRSRANSQSNESGSGGLPSPDVNGLDTRWAGTAVNYRGPEHNLHILVAPPAGRCMHKLVHVAWIHQELSGCDRAPARNSGNNDRETSGIRIERTDDKRIILVGAGILLRSIKKPLLALRMLSIFDPKLIHVRVICKVKSERGGKAQCPPIVVCANEDHGCLTQIAKGGNRFPLYPEGAAVRI